MRLSTWAMNRIVEQQIAGDKARQDALRAKGKVLMMDVRNMSVEDILDKLNSIGLRINREIMSELCIKHISAESLAMWLEKDRKLKNFNEDWTWLGIRVLWERWFPEIQNLEMLDDKMQKGYELLIDSTNHRLLERININVLEVWGETWDDIKNMMDKHGISDIKSFDNVFGGTQSIFNWSMDYDMELENAIVENLEFVQTRIDFCTEYIERYKDKNEHNIKEMMRNVAGTYFRIGNTDIGEELLSKYLKDDPGWGWGWIEWSDQYYLYEDNGIKDTDKAIGILKQGLDVKGLNDRGDVLDRLHNIYIDMDMQDEAEKVMKEINQIGSKKQVMHSKGFITEDSDINIPYVAGNKIGRNNPCPCGSEKKYKKCCGK